MSIDRGNRLIVVAGAAGQQGGAVARHLLAKGWQVRGLTRDLENRRRRRSGPPGPKWSGRITTTAPSLERAMQGAYGAFSVQNFWIPGVGAEGEVRQGKNIADAAKAAADPALRLLLGGRRSPRHGPGAF